ncbi:MAG: GNAT family N-acetyltransferase [Spirochaetes bacterium]|nr:GNAT family N-acetyltransferase [Spirochaetota bacterium]
MISDTVITRIALPSDLPSILDLVNENILGHPAESRKRSVEDLKKAYFSDRPVAELIVAERSGKLLGMIQWTLAYDMFWNSYFGIPEWFFVRRGNRGSGIWLSLIATVCRRVKESGGSGIAGPGNAETTSLYERFCVSETMGSYYRLVGQAFSKVAGLSFENPRTLCRKMPPKSDNLIEAN